MDLTAVYQKTPRGEEEIRTRKAKLAPKLRTMLILMDGTKPLAELQDVAKRLAVPEDFVAALTAQGLIAPVGGAPAAPVGPAAEFAKFSAARRFMNDTVVNAIGLRSFFLTLKIEKCNSRQELADLLEDYGKALAKGFAPEEAAVLGERMRELLA